MERNRQSCCHPTGFRLGQFEEVFISIKLTQPVACISKPNASVKCIREWCGQAGPLSSISKRSIS